MRRKTRSILAITGVVIGTAAITVMMSLGFGLSQGFEDRIKSWGNLHTIELYAGGGFVEPGKQRKEAKLNDKTLKELEQIPYVTAISPEVTTNMTVAVGKYINEVQIVGLKADFFEKTNPEIEEGRLLKKTDKMGVIFGKSAAIWLYNPMGKNRHYEEEKVPVKIVNANIKLTADMSYGRRPGEFSESDKPKDENGNPINFTIYDAKGIGLLKSENSEYSYSIIMNIDDVKNLIKEREKQEGHRESNRGRSGSDYDQAKVYVEETSKVVEVTKALKDLGYMTFSLIDEIEQLKQQMNIIQAVLGGIGAVSLLVAALGITNTMIMSIYERTKEIGIMKVIGANIKDIRKLFLIEAASIGFFGGLAGLAVSFGLSYLANLFLGELFLASMGMAEGAKVSIIPWFLALGSLLFSTGIGILAGYLPANRAMKLSALESLRNE